MKKSKILSLALAFVMLLALVLPAGVSADEPTYPGSITVNIPANLREGATFTVYKVFDVSYNTGKTAYTYTLATAFQGFLGYASNGYATEAALIAAIEGMSDDSDDLNTLAAQLYNYINEEAPSGLVTYTKAAAAGDESVLIDNDEDGIPLGYYIVLGELTKAGEDPDGDPVNNLIVAACSLTTTNPTAGVYPKTDVPAINKKVWDHTTGTSHTNMADAGWKDWTDINIGDTAYFKISTAVPKRIGYNAARPYTFIVHDVMSPGLTLNTASIVVKLEDVSEPLVKDQDYTVATSLSTGAGVDTTITITFISAKFLTYTTGKAITITYDAVLNEHAVIAGVGNPNQVQLEYANNPYHLTNPHLDNPTGTGRTPWYKVRVYTYRLNIFKYTGNLKKSDNTTPGVEGTDYDPVPGAVFKLCKDNSNAPGDPVYFTDKTGGSYMVKKTGASGDELFTSPPSGLINLVGLDAGIYWLVETAPPEGFNPLSAPVKITISQTGFESDGITVIYKIDGNTPVATGVKPADVNVQNNSGNKFPETGGIGTTIFIIGGAAIMVLSLVGYVVSKKRRILNTDK